MQTYTKNGHPITICRVDDLCHGRVCEECGEFASIYVAEADTHVGQVDLCVPCAESLLSYNERTLHAQLLKRGLSAVPVGGCADLSVHGFMVDTLGAKPFTKDGQIVIVEDEDGSGEWAALRYSYNEDEGTVWEEIARGEDPWVALRRAGVVTL